MTKRLKAGNLPLVTPSRGANRNFGNVTTPGTLTPNSVQQDYLAAVAARVVLPLFKERNKPFILVFWSRDPDGTQHYQGDSLNSLVPGINGPTSLAAIRNADNDLAQIRGSLSELGLLDTTDIITVADHGFSTISKESKTSSTVKTKFADTPQGHLPLGFVALDLAQALKLPLIDPDDGYRTIAEGQHTKYGNGLIGGDTHNPKVVVAANGGSDLIYLPDGDKDIAKRVVDALLNQDYVSGIFIDAKLGKLAGTLTLDDVALEGGAVTPHPAIAISFRSFDTVCGEPVRCPVEVADTILQEGQGMHGSFSRADTLFPELRPAARILLGPGPSNVNPRVMKAMASPVVGHLDPDFLKVMENIKRLLRIVFRTKNEITFPVSGTGSAGMETVMANLIEDGDEVVVGVNGAFGTRMAEVASRLGAKVHKVEAEWGKIIEPAQVAAALKAASKPKLVAIIHAETSTGIHQPIEEIAELARRHGAMIAIDAVTSLGCVPVEIDGWG